MIILVRHGEATHHTQKLTGGWTDSDLTPKGRAQLQALGAKLAQDFAVRKIPLRILASDLKRAAESARIIARAIGYPEEKIEYCQFLREKNNGQAAGLTEEEAKNIYCRPASDQELDHRNYPGGETRKEFYERNVFGLKECANWEKENLLIVSHKGTVQNLIFAWMGLNMREVVHHNFSVDIMPASVSILGINKWHEHALFRLNDVSHLQQNQGFGLFAMKFKKNI